MSGEPLSAPGFFGKLPSRGDFVSRRLAADFVRDWDAWLQQALAASEAALGAEWLDVYLTSPLWRFALGPGTCGAEGQLGVLMPSVDRVGRYFPLAAAVACGADPAAPAVAAELEDWYERVEELLLATLADAPLELEAFDARLAALAVERRLALAPADAFAADPLAQRFAAHCAVPKGSALRESLLPQLAARAGGGYSVWWTQGSDRVAPCVLAVRGLPSAEEFTAMLDGRWAERGWRTSTLRRESAYGASPSRLRARSAAVTNAGHVREINEDSYAARDDAGLWIVADGLGGHRAGDTASRMVASLAEQVPKGEALPRRVEVLATGLRAVNGCLRVLAERHTGGALAASTVAALLLHGDAGACIWVGDSRVYRLRGGVLEQLSRDHSDAGAANSHEITRAVGGAEALELDVEQLRVQAGDRYLLCTDGLHGALDAAELAGALERPEPEQACARLAAAVLDGPAQDNFTAVVVHVHAAEGPVE